MQMHKRGDIIANPVTAALVVMLSLLYVQCSPVKYVPEDKTILRQNTIEVTNNTLYDPNTLYPYLKQKPNKGYTLGMNPSLYLYFKKNGKGKGWDKFVDKYSSEPEYFSSELLESSISNLSSHLSYEGFYNSDIDAQVTEKSKYSYVKYLVTLGKRYSIDSVSYHLPAGSIADDFYGLSLNTIIEKGDTLSESNLENVTSLYASELRNNGYYSISKNHFSFIADSLSNNFKTSLEVYLKNFTRNESDKSGIVHKKYYFDSINVILLRNPEIEIAVKGDSAKYNREKYDGINLKYMGKTLLRKSVIAKNMLFREGDLYSDEKASRSYRNFSNLGLFSTVNINLEESDSCKVKSDVYLASSAPQGYKLNLQASTNSDGLISISPAISYFHKNIFRGAEKLTVSAMGDFQFKANEDVRSTEFGTNVSIDFPSFLFLPANWQNELIYPKTTVSLSYNYQNRPEYTRNIISASYGYNWSQKENHFSFMVNPLNVRITKIYNMSEEFYMKLKDPFLLDSYQDHFDLGLTSSFLYTTNPAVNPQTSYFYLRFNNDLSGNVMSLFNNAFDQDIFGKRLIWGSPYSQYYKGEISLVNTIRFGANRKQQFAARFITGVGVGYGNSTTLPFDKRFWIGGAYSLRGWAARTVGPGESQKDTTFKIPNQTGDIKLEMNAEYRFPMFWVFEGAVFADAGNVWEWEKNCFEEEVDIKAFKFNRFYKQIALDWGVGLRFDLKFAILRLDLGFKVFDPASQKWLGPDAWFAHGKNALQFGIGYPF